MTKTRQTHKSIRETHLDHDKRHLDNLNDAWLYDTGDVVIRAPGNDFQQVGTVAHLYGAARVSKALSMVFAHRGY